MLASSIKSTGRALVAVTLAFACVPVAAHAAGGQDLRSPDARDAARVAAATSSTPRQDLRSPDARDAATGRRYPPAPMVVTLKAFDTPGHTAGSGFDWVAAGVGAAIALGVMLLATAALIITRRHGQGSQPVAPA